MPTEQSTIPDDLLRLKPFDDLESVSMSSLARQGTAVLQRVLSTAQAVAVRIQGQGAMVTVSRHQYDEIVALIQQVQQHQQVRQLRQNSVDEDFYRVLGQRFDELVAGMDQPGAADAMETALFGDPAALNETYRPGATESDA